MGVVDDLLAGVQRKLGLGDTGESAINAINGRPNTFGRDDNPQGIKATYVDTDDDGNRVTGASVGQTVQRKPFERAQKESPTATAVGDTIGTGVAELPAFLANQGLGLPGRLLRNYLIAAGRHALSDEQGTPLKKVKSTAQWSVDNPVETALNTLVPEALPAAFKGAKAGINKLLGRAPKFDYGAHELDNVLSEMNQSKHLMDEIPYESDKRRIAKSLLERRRREARVDVPEAVTKQPAANRQEVRSMRVPENTNARLEEPPANDIDDDLLGE